ncbi:MAG TPA: BamA/TamA family outer membrane protein [Sulfurimonas sp.]|uniref:BamA/TamA family outer membrane protein n=1 Tax=Sulfurimonas sp. TaxID=2022749 RepID=UPI002BA7F7CC|nr:BamA/TamA family outer membrane protein [Sulfurimonas sp.]HUH41485.1 BamA/TamA family outer membrane protein [Sulfurimonas sp.]
MRGRFFLFLLLPALLISQELELYFKGNSYITSKELYSSLDLHEPRFYEFYKQNPSIDLKTIDLIIQTLKDYYKTKGFFDAVIELKIDKDSLFLIIEENSPIVIKDISNISDLDLNGVILFKVGDIFDSDRFIKSKKDLRLLYANNHFCSPSIDAKAWIDIDNRSAYLTYESSKNKKCYFKNIEIIPSKDIDEQTVRSALYIQEEMEFSLDAITQSYEELYAYEGISKAIIDTDISKDEFVDVSVAITQNEKPLRFESGIGASSDEGAMVSLGLQNSNFLGNLKTISLRARVTQVKQNIKLNFDMPMANKNFTGYEIGYENEKFLGFSESKLYTDLYLKQRLDKHTFKESILFDKINTYKSSDMLLFPINKLFVLSPKLEYIYDTRDKILDPKSGYFIKSELMGSKKGNLSDATYYKFKATGGNINTVQNSTLALKADYGVLKLIDGELPTSYGFFAGGMHSNRGYGYRKLGPQNSLGDPIGFNSIFEATAEVRFGIYGDFKGVLFSDNTFLSQDTTPDFSSGYHSLGFGFRYLTPIGPIAIDFGFDVKDPRKQYAIHFHIGELF